MLIASVLSMLIVASSATIALGQEDRADPTAVVPDPEIERLFDDVPGMVDHLGRMPLLRLTLEPDAALPVSEHAIPFIAVLETGELDVQLNDSDAALDAGRLIEVGEGQSFAAHNPGEERASLLVLAQFDDINDPLSFELVFPVSNMCHDCLPEGLIVERVTLWQHVIMRLAPARFSVDRIVLPPGSTFDAIDQGGDTDPFSIVLNVESGVIAFDGEVIDSAEDRDERMLRESNTDPVVMVIGDEPAVVLIMRMGEADETA